MEKEIYYDQIDTIFDEYTKSNGKKIMDISEHEYLYRNKKGNLSLKYCETFSISLKNMTKDGLKTILSQMN